MSEAANDRYWRGAGVQPPVAATGLLYPPMAVNLTMLLVQQSVAGGLLHTWGRLRCHAPAAAGQDVEIKGAVSERFEKRGRDYCVVETQVRSEREGLIWTAETELASSRPRPGATDTAAPQRPRHEIPSGVETTSRHLALTADLLRTYSRSGNFHSDDAAARQMGLPGMVAMGMQTLGPAWGIVLEEAAEELLARAEVETRFFGLVLEDETVEASVAHVDDGWIFSIRNETRDALTGSGVIRLA